MRTLEEIVGNASAESKAHTVIFGVFGLVALALTSIGIYGALAYAVAQRGREIGVRIALGASPAAAFRLVLRDGLRLTAVGMALGFAAAAALTRFMQGLLFEVAPLDLVAFASVGALLASVAALACAIPASRASWIDPAVVLRQE
jgi:putative ABC transport system permease protein